MTDDNKLIKALLSGYVVSSLIFNGIPGLSNLSGIFCFISFAYLLFKYGWTAIVDDDSFYVLLFISYVFLLMLYGSDFSFNVFASTVISWVGALLLAFFIKRRVFDINILIAILVAASLINGLGAIYGFDSYYYYSQDQSNISIEAVGKRSSSFVGNANLYAVQSILPIFIVYIWANRWRYLLSAGALFGAGLSIIYSGSRKSIILVIFYLIMISVGLYGFKGIFVILLCVGAIYFWQASYGGGLVELVGVLNIEVLNRVVLALDGEDDSFLDRSNFIQIGIDLFFDRILFGYGLDMFRVVSGVGLYSHNNIIELAVSGGIFAIMLYYKIYIKTFNKINIFSNNGGLVKLIFLLALLSLDFSMVTFNVKIVSMALIILLMDDVNYRVDR